MIRRLLYLFRRMVLVWRLRRLERKIEDVRGKEFWSAGRKYYWLHDVRLEEQLDAINLQLNKLDATEMSKGDAHVVVR